MTRGVEVRKGALTGARAVAATVACPYCARPVGAPCVSDNDRLTIWPHRERFKLAQAKAASRTEGDSSGQS